MNAFEECGLRCRQLVRMMAILLCIDTRCFAFPHAPYGSITSCHSGLFLTTNRRSFSHLDGFKQPTPTTNIHLPNPTTQTKSRHRQLSMFPMKKMGERSILSSRTLQVLSRLRGGAAFLSSTTSAAWLFPAFVCAVSYAMYNLSIKKASDSIHPLLGGVLLQLVAAGVGILSLGAVSQLSSTPLFGSTRRSGVYWSIVAGVAVGLAELLSFVISGMGVPATQSIPVLIGGSILVGTLLGVVWLQEQLTLRGWLGVLSIAIGVVLIGLEGGGGHG